MNEINKIKPFKQVPYCEDNVMLTMTPKEYEVIQSALNIFKDPLNAMENIFNRNINEGNILIKYVQADGTEISKEEAEEFLKTASEIIKNKTTE